MQCNLLMSLCCIITDSANLFTIVIFVLIKRFQIVVPVTGTGKEAEHVLMRMNTFEVVNDILAQVPFE
jgi:hypothetical protein